MKNIVAVMRLSKVAQTRAALEEAGFSDFVSRRAMGRGSVEVNDGEAQGDCLIPRRVIYLSVADEDVSRLFPGQTKFFPFELVDAFVLFRRCSSHRCIPPLHSL